MVRWRAPKRRGSTTDKPSPIGIDSRINLCYKLDCKDPQQGIETLSLKLRLSEKQMARASQTHAPFVFLVGDHPIWLSVAKPTHTGQAEWLGRLASGSVTWGQTGATKPQCFFRITSILIDHLVRSVLVPIAHSISRSGSHPTIRRTGLPGSMGWVVVLASPFSPYVTTLMVA